MAGAIVPDDWDGVSYTERRVVWPNSEKWLEILRGGLSQPAFLDFWDADTGDEESATETGKNLISLNLVGGFYPSLLGGEDVWFQADRTCISPHSLTGGVWTQLAFPCNKIGVPNASGNPAGWNGTSHVIREEQYGLWLYQIGVGGLSSPGGQQFVGLQDFLPTTPEFKMYRTAGNGHTYISGVLVLYVDQDADIRPMVNVSVNSDFNPVPEITYFKGVRLEGPIL